MNEQIVYILAFAVLVLSQIVFFLLKEGKQRD